MEPVTIKGLTFGAGLPKICVPLTAPTLPKLIAEAENAAAHRGKDADLCEWRVDSYIYRNTAAVREAFWNLRQVLKGMPLLVTLRTKSEGGGADCTGEGYLYRIEELIRLRPDLIDIELLTAGGPATRAVWEAHQAGVKVVLSSHDFNRTPSAAEMMTRIAKMDGLGADLCKIAVMPQCAEDVLTLLGVSVLASAIFRAPLITMSMGRLGAVSRLCGSLSGSAVTFGTLGDASAPGQLPAGLMAEILPLLGNEE